LVNSVYVSTDDEKISAISLDSSAKIIENASKILNEDIVNV